MKNADNLKEKIRSGKMTIGSWLSIDNEITAEILAKMGFDWLTVDMEHSAIDLNMVQKMVRVIELSGVHPLVRVSENDANLIKQVMDTGAHGIIVPMVKTAEDAHRAVQAVHYPPKGNRGVGLSRAQGYGLSFEKYRQWLSKESIVIAIIEHIDAINNLEEILSVEGIDATMIGPYDLSGSMGFPGQFERRDVQACIKRYMHVCRKLNKPSGFHVVEPQSTVLNKKIKEGCRFLAFGTDELFLARGVQLQIASIKRKVS
jgi:2-keto-3-deoxy-L-rhamnonate aldolase RhmA